MLKKGSNKVGKLDRRNFLKFCVYAILVPAFFSSGMAMAQEKQGGDFTLYNESKTVRVEVSRDGKVIKCRVMEQRGGRWMSVPDQFVMVRDNSKAGKFDEQKTDQSGRTEHDIGATAGMEIAVGVPGLIKAQTGSVK